MKSPLGQAPPEPMIDLKVTRFHVFTRVLAGRRWFPTRNI